MPYSVSFPRRGNNPEQPAARELNSYAKDLLRLEILRDGQTRNEVRCLNCRRLACDAPPGSRVRVKCVRCGDLFERALQA